MSKELKKGEGRVFEAWSTTDCDECGQDFQVTRSVSKTVFGPVVCHDCKDYKKAYEEGVESVKSQLDAQSAYIEELKDVLSELVDLMEDTRSGDYKPDSFTCQPAKRVLSQSPTTSPEQVNKPTHDWESPDFSTCSKCGDKDWMADTHCSESKLVNNLKEKG